MSDRIEPAFAVTGEDEIYRRLMQIERRLESVHDQIDANQREADDLQERQGLLIAEHESLRLRFNALREART